MGFSPLTVPPVTMEWLGYTTIKKANFYFISINFKIFVNTCFELTPILIGFNTFIFENATFFTNNILFLI